MRFLASEVPLYVFEKSRVNSIRWCVLFRVGGVGFVVYGSGAAIERDEKQVRV